MDRMDDKDKYAVLKSVIFHFAAVLVGVVFVYSGFVKAVDPLGTVYKIQDYLEVMHLSALNCLAIVASFALFTIEFVSGLMLLFGINVRIGLWLVSLMMACMTPLTLWIALADPVSDCGCFGDALVISNWATFWKNIVIDTLIVLMWIFRRNSCHWLAYFREWGVTIVSVLAVICFGLYTLDNLPIIDFRPYKIGTDILKAMELPEGARPDLYETTFVYSKNGERRTFSLQDAPYSDSTWVFEEQITKLIRKGDEPAIHDFSIVTPEGDDITYDILYSDGRTYLVAMYDLTKTDEAALGNIQHLYERAQQEGAEFVALTASSSLIDEFKAAHGITYQFALTDPIQLKTMVRANPGVVVLEGSVVVDKFNAGERRTAK